MASKKEGDKSSKNEIEKIKEELDKMPLEKIGGKKDKKSLKKKEKVAKPVKEKMGLKKEKSLSKRGHQKVVKSVKKEKDLNKKGVKEEKKILKNKEKIVKPIKEGKGLKKKEKIKHHRGRVSVMLCDLSSCVGGEDGCDGSQCYAPTWRKWGHDYFRKIFDR